MLCDVVFQKFYEKQAKVRLFLDVPERESFSLRFLQAFHVDRDTSAALRRDRTPR